MSISYHAARPTLSPSTNTPENNEQRRGRKISNQCQTWYHGIKFYRSTTQRKRRHRRRPKKKSSQAKPTEKKEKKKHGKIIPYRNSTKEYSQQYKYNSICKEKKIERDFDNGENKTIQNHLENFPSTPTPTHGMSKKKEKKRGRSILTFPH